MGSFGYICRGCGTQIVGDSVKGGEKCVLIHVRHGEELGRVEGHYNEYGGVIEQSQLPENEKFRGVHDGLNGHREICKSEIFMPDAYNKIMEKRIYGDEEVTYEMYLYLKFTEDAEKLEDIRESKYFKLLNPYRRKLIQENLLEGDDLKAKFLFTMGSSDLNCNIWKLPEYKEFLNLAKAKREAYSGIVAWHSYCYNKATEDERNDLTPSEPDPNQSWGKVRKKYI